MRNTKKKIVGKTFALAILIGIVGKSDAQWTTPTWNSSNTAAEWTNGTVGIGSSSITSGASLDLGSNLAIRGTHLIYNSLNGVVDWGGGSGNLYFRSLSTQGVTSSGYTNLMTLTYGGNLGINTTSPGSLLSVNQGSNTSVGTTSSYGIALYNQGTVNLTIGSDGSFGYLQSWQSKPLVINNQGNNTLINPNSGNVGIGTGSPSEKLDVSGADANGVISYFRNGNYWNLLGANLGSAVYNNITQANDNGIFWTNSTGGNTTNGFVIAPWKSSTMGMRIDGSTGNFGMYSGTNVTALTIGSASSSTLDYGTSYLGFNAARGSSGTWTVNTNTANNGGAIMYGDIFGDMRFVTIPYGEFAANTVNQNPTDAQVIGNTIMKISSTGKVVIGNPFAATGAVTADNVTTPGSYTLYVAGGILTEQVRVAVANSTSWADYVFANDYKLKPLNEVEQYLKANKHLPEVPSAQEVKDNGVDVATMDATLLKKIEELTLYVIELQKQNNNLQENNKDNSLQIQQLQAELKQLSNKK